MKTATFWTSVLIAAFVVFAGVALISNPEESQSEGYIGAELEEDVTPVTFFDFTDEPPMLITPNMSATGP